MGISKELELVYSNSMKVNMGDYEQLNPFYSAKLIITSEETDIAEELEHLRAVVDKELEKNVTLIKNVKKEKEISSFRFYEKNGVKYVSVTSVLNEPKTPEELERLKPYSERGKALHRIFSHAISNKEWLPFTQEEKRACESIGGFEGFDFWFKGNPRYDFSFSEVEVFNDEYLFAGKYDADGFFEEQVALFDLKSGYLDKKAIQKAFLQLAAYNLAKKEKVSRLVILPMNPKNKREPIVAGGEEITKYEKEFLDKRKQFKDKYGI